MGASEKAAATYHAGGCQCGDRQRLVVGVDLVKGADTLVLLCVTCHSLVPAGEATDAQ
jgi:hypothetical protein